MPHHLDISTDEVRRFLSNLIPREAKLQGVVLLGPYDMDISYIDLGGVHETVRWSAVSVQEVA